MAQAAAARRGFCRRRPGPRRRTRAGSRAGGANRRWTGPCPYRASAGRKRAAGTLGTRCHRDGTVEVDAAGQAKDRRCGFQRISAAQVGGLERGGRRLHSSNFAADGTLQNLVAEGRDRRAAGPLAQRRATRATRLQARRRTGQTAVAANWRRSPHPACWRAPPTTEPCAP